MAVHDYILANQSGSSFRSDLNNALAAIVSQNSNATEPATKYAYQYWIDTSATPALIKQRNAANDAWITLAEVDGQTLAADGTDAKPGIAFAADINTGLKRNAADDVSIVTGGTQAITVDSSQNVGVGTTSPSDLLHVSADGSAGILIERTGAPAKIQSSFGGGDAAFTYTVNSASSYMVGIDDSDGDKFKISFGSSDNAAFETNDYVVIDSAGRVMVNTANINPVSGNVQGMAIRVEGNTIQNVTSNNVFNTFRRNTNGSTHRFYMNSATHVGSISVTSSATAFNTSSDYRLKENIVNLDGAITRLKQLAPKRFNFIINPDATVDGFLAHEAQAVVPEAVTGTHDGLEVWTEGEELPDGVSVGDNKLDDDGNTIPDYQGIDQSKLVPLLTAALQEAIAKIETLETKVAALEAAN